MHANILAAAQKSVNVAYEMLLFGACSYRIKQWLSTEREFELVADRQLGCPSQHQRNVLLA